MTAASPLASCAGDVQRRAVQKPSFNRHDRLLEAERREQTGGVEPRGEFDRRTLELRREVQPVHRVEPILEPLDEVGVEHVPFDRSKRADTCLRGGGGFVLGGLARDSLVCRLSRALADVDIDRGRVAAARGERARNPRSIADPDFEQSIVAGKFRDEDTTDG